MAPDAELVALKVGTIVGRATPAPTSTLWWLFQNARAQGIGVVNISRTVNGGQTVLTEDAAVNNLVRTHGILFVTTPGNGWTNQPALGRVGSPGSAREAITVGAITPYDERAAYSQPGHPGQSVPKPDLVAPGGTFRTPLLLPDANTSACDAPPCAAGADPFPDDYRGFDGTSFAAPLVAGVLAQLLEADGGWQHDHAQVRRLRALLTMTATPVGAAAP
ncbi:MAG: S8 family serine peptidase [bacterium]